MKKVFATILCCTLALSATACNSNVSDTAETTETVTTTEAIVETVAEDINTKIDEKLNKMKFEGIVYITNNDSVVYSTAIGKNEKGADLTVESPRYLGSVSKQFCATAIMMLKEQNKLSVNDTLDKYFPEYERGKDITIQNLLTMRSGIPDFLTVEAGFSSEKSESENVACIKEWVFSQPLDFEPDTSMMYSNTNYFLLGNIVEMVSEQSYNEFIRENIFKPLEMNNSGFVNEVADTPYFSAELTYETFNVCEEKGTAKGAGDIVSTASDMNKWMTGLTSGKIISEESYREMTTDHSPDYGTIYGYGLSGMYKSGFGHSGKIGDFMALDYFNEELGYNVFVATDMSCSQLGNMPMIFMDLLVSE